MKRIALFLFPLLLLASCAQKPGRVELSDWQFSWHNQWYPAVVPGFIHTDLMANGLIPDPYYGLNEDSVQWVNGRTWIYRTSIPCGAIPAGDALWLVFEGLAGNASLWIGSPCSDDTVDGAPVKSTKIGSMDNMFRRYEVPLPGKEQLKVQFACKDSLTLTVVFEPLADSLREAGYGITLPERRAFTRIAPYQQGWDWGPRLSTCGIWKDVYITNEKPVQEPVEAPQSQVTLRQDPDSIGQGFTFYRDGKPLFIKGANWIPVHSFPVLDAAQKARYRTLLVSAKEAGFNMLRVWGGGIYEHDYFYSLCDSLGLMVWQDFMFAGTPYPDSPDMLENIRHEARQQVSRIARHPCVVVWCGNNEVKNGWEDWGWQGVFNWTPAQRARIEHAMDTIFGYSSTASNTSNTSILAQAVRDCDPLQRPYITTSPLYGWGHPECVTHGDSHYWGVWWGELPFEVYKEKTGRFMSEYGFQSYPMMGTLRQFCPEGQLSIDSPVIKSHQKHSRGREIIDKAMRRYYGFDSRSLSLEDYAYVSQLLQAWGVGYGILSHLADPRCSGTLYWQLNDCWPVASWSSIDYYGNWKALHYRAQALFDDKVDLARWEKYYSVYPKDRQYTEPHFQLQQSWTSDGALQVALRAETDLYDLCFETTPHVNGHFSSNFIDIPAGQKVTVKFIPADPAADISQVRVSVRTLNDLYTH